MNDQLRFWKAEGDKPAINSYDYIIVNSSGGKDSQTQLRYVYETCRAQGFPVSRIIVAHADLGRMEWPGTKNLAEKQARSYGLRFIAVARPQGDLLDHIEDRGMWPSSTTRYCTSDHKRGQIQKVFTQLSRESPGKAIRILNCMGFRAEESPARAKRKPLELNTRGTTQTRTIDTWLPIHEWKEAEVWDSIRESQVPHHPAYDLGMPRLSCIFCIFAPKPALILAGRHNPELLNEYVRVERKIGHTFRKELKIEDIREAIEKGAGVEAMSGAWNM